MAERRAEESSIAPRRSLSGSGGSSAGTGEQVSPPKPKPGGRDRKPEKAKRERRVREVKARHPKPVRPDATASWAPSQSGRSPGPTRPPREAHLRVSQVDPWSVTKTAFLLSIAFGVVTVVAVAIVWTVLGASGLWDSINTTVQETLGDSTGEPFEIQEYLGVSRVLGFTMIVAVVDVVLITMIATLGAFLYNLAATLLGGVEVTLSEDD